jgi:membrane-bound ClpP family serine protease
VKRITAGVLVAALLAMVLAGASFAGIAAWKIVLAAIGVVLFIFAGGSGTPSAPNDRG